MLVSISMWKAAAAKSLQSCLTLCDPIDGSPAGSPVPGILQARTLEWFSLSFFKAWKWKVKVKSLSYVWPSETPWTAAHKAPPSMGFSRQEYWSGLPLPFLRQELGTYNSTHFDRWRVWSCKTAFSLQVQARLSPAFLADCTEVRDSQDPVFRLDLLEWLTELRETFYLQIIGLL